MAYDEQLAARVSDLMHARRRRRAPRCSAAWAGRSAATWPCGVMRTDHMVMRSRRRRSRGDPRAHVHEFGRPGAKPIEGLVVVEPEGLADDAALADGSIAGRARAMELPVRVVLGREPRRARGPARRHGTTRR